MRKVIAVIGVLLIALAFYSIQLVPDGIQAVTAAQSELPDISEETSAVHAVMPSASFYSADKGSLGGELYAINERYTEFYPLYLKSGRLFYKEEAQRGADVCLIDENIAFSLFSALDPLGRELMIGEKTYRIVGVVKAAAQIGTGTENRIYIPFRGATGQFQILVRTDSFFEETPEGTIITLRKEKMRGLLLARLLLIFICASVLAKAAKVLKAYGKGKLSSYREALRDKYPRQMILSALGPSLLVTIGWGAVLIAAVWLATMLFEPAYTFVEWVPDVLVEFSSIKETFWKNMRLNSGYVKLQTQELIRLSHWGYVANIGAIMVLFSLGRLKSLCKVKKG